MKNRRPRQWLLLVAALILLLAVVGLVRYRMAVQANRPAPLKTVTVQHPDVAVMVCNSGRYRTHIIAYGSAHPHYELSLTAQVTGQLTRLSAKFEAGYSIGKGELLAQLDDRDYRAAVASAEQELSEARVSLLEEQRQAAQAAAEWQGSGLSGAPDSALVLRQPQLAAAEAAVASAEASLTSARKDLANTRISAPFSALIVERAVAPGSYLQTGSEIATLYSTDFSEIEVSLAAKDWQQLPSEELLLSGSWQVTLTAVESGQVWTGTVLRTEQHLDNATRKRTLVVKVAKPFAQQPPLLPDSFLRVDIPGRTSAQLWKLPNSTLSQKGEIWFVKADQTLASFSATPLFSDSAAIYVQPPAELAATAQRVLIHPLSSYLVGMQVNPVEENSHE